VREGIYKVTNAKSHEKEVMEAQVVRHAWCVWGDLGSSLACVINV